MNPKPEELEAARKIYERWDEALGRRDLDGSMALYTPDAILESPLVSHLLRSESGIVHGASALREFVREVYARPMSERHRHRTGFLTDGKTLMWEYPRATPNGDQVDLLEVMELDNGSIRRHRVYWGWYGVKLLTPR
jgi:hypothetical protein